LKQLQEFLGTVNYVRPHAGPEFVRIPDLLKVLLRPGAAYPQKDMREKAIEAIKAL
jgi:hypothetical protein